MGDMYVSDSVLKHVFVFDKEGNYLRAIGPPDMFQRPAGIALDEDRIYVVDTHGHKDSRIITERMEIFIQFWQAWNRAWKFQLSDKHLCKQGKTHLCYGLDELQNTDFQSRTEASLTSFGKLGDGSGNFSKPKGIAVDSEGHIYVVDSHFDNVQIFDGDGNLLLVFGSSGNGTKANFILPAGIYIDKRRQDLCG